MALATSPCSISAQVYSTQEVSAVCGCTLFRASWDRTFSTERRYHKKASRGIRTDGTASVTMGGPRKGSRFSYRALMAMIASQMAGSDRQAFKTAPVQNGQPMLPAIVGPARWQ
jgi:hypothetical protein